MPPDRPPVIAGAPAVARVAARAWRLLAAALASLPAIAGAQAAPPPSPLAVQADVAALGATRAVAALARDGLQPGTRWGWVMAGIETGRPEWLRVAALIRPGTDAVTTPALLDALSTALRHDAPGVLALMGRAVPPEALCRPRMAAPRPIDLRVFQIHTHDAVAAVARPDLRPMRDRCLAVLAAAEKER